jgi:magnesium-transporting ATPase (P-type)
MKRWMNKETTELHTINDGNFGIHKIMEALVEPIIISTILVINALVGGYQSLNASKGISALKKMQAQKAVLRLCHTDDHAQPSTQQLDNNTPTNSIQEVEVDAATLVPGDIVLLSVGQKIPADIRLLSVSTSSFTVDEASLTGESDSVPKTPYVGDVQIADDVHAGHTMDDLDEIQENVGSMGKHAMGMLYSGTVITQGKGVGVVVRTGMSTEMGKVV